MSENTLTMKSKTGNLGVKLALRNFKKYLAVGILLPLLMMIPSMIIQYKWIEHDKNGTDPYTEYTLYDGELPEGWEDKFEMQDGKYLIPEEKDWTLQEHLKGVTDYGFVVVFVCMYIYMIFDVTQCFWGKRAALELVVPCSKPVIFISKLIPASVCMLWASFLVRIASYFLSGGLKWVNGSIEMVRQRGIDTLNRGYLFKFPPMIEWGPISFFMMCFFTIYIGVVLLLALCGELKRKLKDYVIGLIVAGISIVAAEATWVVSEVAFDKDILSIMFIFPISLLVFCIILLRRHNMITT